MQHLYPSGFRSVLEQLYVERTLTPYAPGVTIPLKNDSLFVIYRGIVRLTTIHANGEETLLGLAGPSMPVGLPLTIVEPYQAVALTPVDALWLTVSEIDASDILAAGLYRQAILRLRQAEAWLALSGKRPIAARLRHLLLVLAQEFGQTEGTETFIPLRLTHQDLANAIGVTRVTVTRLLGDFRAEGWLRFDRYRRLIVKVDRLQLLLD